MDEPTSIRAGDSVAWTATLPDFPASAGWSLKYRILSATGAVLEFNATASGESHVVNLTAAQTATLTAGAATLVRYVTRGTERVTLGSQPLTVLPDLTVQANYDGRTANQKALADAEAALAKYLANGQGHVESYTIGDRSFKFRGVAEIRELIAYYRRAVSRERFALSLLNGGEPPGRVYYRG